MRFIDCFGGIGGFRLGLERLGHECVGYYEWDKPCVQVYNRGFGTSHEPTDIAGVGDGDFPKHDILCAGFPCQAFSIAGRRRGFEDVRGTLFFEVARIARARQPPILFLENVPGLLSHDRGNTFKTILHTLDEVGYDAEWHCINSKNHGVPQNRERLFIIGHLRGKPRRQVFPLRESDGISKEENRRQPEEGQGVQCENSSAITSNYHKGVHCTGETYVIQKSPDWRKDGTLRKFTEKSPTLRANMGDNAPMVVVHNLQKRDKDRPSLQKNRNAGGSGHLSRDDGNVYCLDTANQQAVELKQLTENMSDAQRVYDPEGLARTLKSGGGGQGGKTGLYAIQLVGDRANPGVSMKDEAFTLTANPMSDRQQAVALTEARTEDAKRIRRESKKQGKDWSPRRGKVLQPRTDGIGNCVTTSQTPEHLLMTQTRYRRLTPTECERLQGFPDGWTRGFSDTQRYKMLGNAVTVNVIEAIGRRL